MLQRNVPPPFSQEERSSLHIGLDRALLPPTILSNHIPPLLAYPTWRQLYHNHFNPEEGCHTFLYNSGIHLQDYTVSQSRKS
ncbi:hypothetical protein B7P43_G02317 [Cryptotermes secundus]|uniref:Uncharacterized protein n=1 Tax=Cryptotermes secundus TaxID=105785 RepID=A0A2J7RCT2_9NEOP|nr:hypothetical protein B7P43_G02317 [Cryptotermes secundus]